METIAIIGVGLIGGSFGLALRESGFKGRILGVSSEKTTRTAVERGAIDEAAAFDDAAARADLIFLAAPILTILNQLERIDVFVRPGTLITDAGSTKAAIVNRAQKNIRTGAFLGGHPMAGKERSGIAEAEPGLFRARPWALCPAKHDDLETEPAREFVQWIRRIGGEPVILPPEVHDNVVAYTSHLPQLVSTSLAAVLQQVPGAEALAGPALRDLTRLAASPYPVWRDIFLTNEGPIRSALSELLRTLTQVDALLLQPDLSQVFEIAQDMSLKLRSSVSR